MMVHAGFVDLDLDGLITLLSKGNSDACFTGVFVAKGHEVPRTWRVWRRGRLARIEEPPGTLVLVAGERTYWRKWPVDPAVVAIPRSPDHDDFELSRLTRVEPERYWSDWLRQDGDLVTSSLRATVYEGRPAWSFTAPEVKGARPVITVDAEIGLVLEASSDDIGVFESWSDVRTDADLDDDLFRFDGTREFDAHRRYPQGWAPG